MRELGRSRQNDAGSGTARTGQTGIYEEDH